MSLTVDRKIGDYNRQLKVSSERNKEFKYIGMRANKTNASLERIVPITAALIAAR